MEGGGWSSTPAIVLTTAEVTVPEGETVGAWFVRTRFESDRGTCGDVADPSTPDNV